MFAFGTVANANWMQDHVRAYGPASDISNFTRLDFKEGDKSKGSGRLSFGNVSYFTCSSELNSKDCERMIPGKLVYCYYGGSALDLSIGEAGKEAALDTGIVVKANVCGCYGVSLEEHRARICLAVALEGLQAHNRRHSSLPAFFLSLSFSPSNLDLINCLLIDLS